MNAEGRPVVLDDAMKLTVCRLLRAGCSRRCAAQYLGIDESTLRKAAERDETFRRDMGEASVGMEMDCLTRIQRESERSWRTAAWLLERKCPEEYARGRAKSSEGIDGELFNPAAVLMMERMTERALGPMTAEEKADIEWIRNSPHGAVAEEEGSGVGSQGSGRKA